MNLLLAGGAESSFLSFLTSIRGCLHSSVELIPDCFFDFYV
jgi:hypothetical protein